MELGEKVELWHKVKFVNLTVANKYPGVGRYLHHKTTVPPTNLIYFCEYIVDGKFPQYWAKDIVTHLTRKIRALQNDGDAL